MKKAGATQPIIGAGLRQFAGNFATGVAVITAPKHKGDYRGLTMNAVTSLSLDPPLYLICLANNSNTLSAVRRQRHFAINFLSARQIDVSKRFASKDPNKFDGIKYFVGDTGCPILSGVVAACECKVKTIHQGGDHKIVVGSVEHIHLFKGDPLIFHQGKFISHDFYSPPRSGRKTKSNGAVAATT